jgi:hypothetical protein
MITSPRTSFLYEIAARLPIPLEKRAYFHARLINRIYAFVLDKFLEKQKSESLTKAELARRIGRKPEVITRLLGAPGNWTLETVSDLLLGIAGEELEPASSSLLDRVPRNIAASDLIGSFQDMKQTQEKSSQFDPIAAGLSSKAPPTIHDPTLSGGLLRALGRMT